MNKKIIFSVSNLIKFTILMSLVNLIRNCLQEINPPDDSRSYSSILGGNNSALGNAKSMLDSSKAWIAGTNQIGEWIKLDLSKNSQVVGIITQRGHKSEEYITKFNLEYSVDDINYISMNLSFTGILNPENSSKRHYAYVPSAIFARYVKVIVTEWERNISVRIGVLAFEFTSENCFSLPAGFFWDLDSKIVRSCDASCFTCLDDWKSCSSCNVNYFPVENSSLCLDSQNSQGYFIDSKDVYVKCDYKCRTCTDSPTYCNICNTSAGYYPLENDMASCEKKGYPGYYFDEATDILRKCDSSICKTCTEKADKCIECANGLYKIYNANSEQLDKCYEPSKISRYYLDSNMNIPLLKPCDPSCLSCSGKATNCKSCKSGNFLKESPTNSTETFCDNKTTGYYLGNGESIYKTCDVSCKECVNEANQCLSCADHYFRDNNIICSLIKEGYFLNSKDNTLKKCDASCHTCELNSKNCIKCADNLFKAYNSTKEESNYCVKLTLGNYIDSNNLIRKCDDSCIRCEENSFNCLDCALNYFKVANVLDYSKNICLKSDSIGYYLDTSKKLLFKCDMSCKTCEHSTANCMQCADDFFKINKNEIDASSVNPNLCYDSKKEIIGFFLNKNENLFNKCALNCKTCKARPENCIVCNDNYIKDSISGKCVNKIKGFDDGSESITNSELLKGDEKMFVDVLKKECFKNFDVVNDNSKSIIDTFRLQIIYLINNSNRICLDLFNQKSLKVLIKLQLKNKENLSEKNNQTIITFLDKVEHYNIVEININNLIEGEYYLDINVIYKLYVTYSLKKRVVLFTPRIIPSIRNEKNLKFEYGEDIEIDASSSFIEGHLNGENKSLLKFDWKFDEEFYKSFDIENTNHSLSILKIKREDYFIRNKNLLNFLKESNFKINLNITLANRISTQRTINFNMNFNSYKKEELFKIDLLLNKANIDYLIFDSIFTDTNIKLEDFNLQWTVTNFKDIERYYLNGRKERKLKIKSSDLIDKFNNITLCLFNKSTDDKIFCNSYLHQRLEEPYGGSFIISPNRGISLETNFKFQFKNWKTNSKYLIFRIYFRDEKNKEYDINNPEISLGNPLGENLYEVSYDYSSNEVPVTDMIHAEIKDILGLSVRVSYKIKAFKNKNIPILQNLYSNIPESDIIYYSKMNYMIKSNSENYNSKENEIPLNVVSAATYNLNEKIKNQVLNDEDKGKAVKVFSEITGCVSGNNNEIFEKMLNLGKKLINDLNTEQNISFTESMFTSINTMSNSLIELGEKDRIQKLIETENVERTISEKLVEGIIPGENLVVENKNFQINVDKFSSLNVHNIQVIDEEDIEDNFKKRYKKNRRKEARIRRLQKNSNANCNDGSILCLDKNFTDKLMNETNSSVIGFKSKVFKNKNVPIEFNSTQSVFSENSLDFGIGVADGHDKTLRFLSESSNYMNNYNYEIRLKIPPNKNSSVIDDTTCTEGANAKINYCNSWYDSETNEVICVCNSQALISNVQNKNFANLSKLLQIKDFAALFGN